MIQANSLYIPLKDESVQCVKVNTHRNPKLFWNKEWLTSQYLLLKKSASQIANENGCKENNILSWLKKHGIETRSTEEIRKIKKWGLSGKQNGMYGRTGKTNPNWKGGVAPERQALYTSRKWSKAVSFVWKRDNAACQVCFVSGGRGKLQLHVHHIKSFALHPELRCSVRNLILVCKPCHNKLHSRG